VRMSFNALNGNVSREGNVDNTQNIISFCTGYGGLELGIRRAGVDVRTIVNVEIEAFCCANLVAKTEEGRMDNAPIWTDLKTFPAREFRGKVHGLIGGYPCQPFSSAGKRQGEKDPRHLWPYILKHIRAIGDVQWCFFENVAGHTTMGLWRVLSDLEEEGYRCAWGIFSAEEVGAPHQRKRVFILAHRKDIRLDRSLAIKNQESTEWNDASRQGTTQGVGATILGNTASKRPHRGSENCEGEQTEVLGERLESDGELANPTSRQPRQSQARNGGQDTSGGSEDTQWPARPGEEQYEWEEPRVTEIESFVRGATNGTQHRVDRLRLLGNGVVPQTAELAWTTLWKELMSPSPQEK
jgi:DNA (cytosine-5)-methyltransferase 1